MSSRRERARPIAALGAALVGTLLGALIWIAPAIGQEADHLLIYRIMARTRTPPETWGSPYVQVVNPGSAAFALDDVYLTNGNFATSSTYYYHLVDAPGQTGGGSNGFFHVRFPGGLSLAAGDTVIVSINGSTDFQAAYGRVPDFELYEDALQPDTVPEMVPAFPGAVGTGLNDPGSNSPELDASNLCLVLYHWDGQNDLVQDLDYVIWGTDAQNRYRVDKTGVTSEGPDADGTPSTYNDDTAVASQTAAASQGPAFGRTIARTSATEPGETQSGGNGYLFGDIGGNDETSEDLAASWITVNSDDPPAQTAPAVSPAPILTAASLLPNPPVAGQSAVVAVTLLAVDEVETVNILYAIDGGSHQTIAATSGPDDSWSATLPPQPAGAEVGWYVEATASGGGALVWPYGSPRFEQTFTVAEPGSGPTKLLISEVCVFGTPDEFIEIHNPNAFDVDMSDYYLTDAIFAPGSQYYWRIAEGNPAQDTVGGGAFADFHARFPDGYTIAAGEIITVAVPGADSFNSSYGELPTLELYEEGDLSADVPDMRPVFGPPDDGNSIVDRAGDSLPTLSNSGEIVILYYWDGVSDLVVDVDVFAWGSNDDAFFSKTGVRINNSTYQDETSIGSQDPFLDEHSGGESFSRIDLQEGGQVSAGSNGVNGRDEVSENWYSAIDVGNEISAETFAIEGSSPGRLTVQGPGGVELVVPARTFNPRHGELFPVGIVTQPDAETKLRIFDMEGRLVITLFDSRFDGRASTLPGEPTILPWDGRDETFERVAAGVYVVHLSVVDPKTGNQETKTAPAVVATQLSD